MKMGVGPPPPKLGPQKTIGPPKTRGPEPVSQYTLRGRPAGRLGSREDRPSGWRREEEGRRPVLDGEAGRVVSASRGTALCFCGRVTSWMLVECVRV